MNHVFLNLESIFRGSSLFRESFINDVVEDISRKNKEDDLTLRHWSYNAKNRRDRIEKFKERKVRLKKKWEKICVKKTA